MAPSYSPAAGRVPLSVAVAKSDWPGVSVRLVLSRATWALVSGSRCERERARVTVELPPLVIWRRWLAGRELDELRMPNETVAGFTVTLVDRAAPASSNPPPTAVTRAAPDSSVSCWLAVFTMADLISSGPKPGCFCFTSAAAPATMGVEKLVPFETVYPSGL